VEYKVLDTDLIVELLRGNERAKEYVRKLEGEALLCTTAINMFELYYGAYKLGKEAVEHVKRLETRLVVLNVDSRAAEEAAEEQARLSAQGMALDVRDLLIGATARRYGCVLVTGNVKHMKRIYGLKVENWRSESGV